MNAKSLLRKKFNVGVGMDMVDGGLETETAGRRRIPINLKRFSDVLRHIVTKVYVLFTTDT